MLNYQHKTADRASLRGPLKTFYKRLFSVFFFREISLFLLLFYFF